MLIRKILLKTLSGVPVATLTLRLGIRPSVLFPPAFLPIACECDGEGLPLSEQPFLPAGSQGFSLIGEMNGELLFASTLPAAQAILARERLLLRRREPSSLHEPTLPCSEEADEKGAREIPTSPEEADEEREGAPQESTPASTRAQNDRRKHAIEKIEKGEPFDLFRESMPTYRWAKIKEEDGEYLLGVEEGTDAPHLLLGIAGSQDYPPDEERLWTFFPTEGEMGYYLTEEVQ